MTPLYTALAGAVGAIAIIWAVWVRATRAARQRDAERNTRAILDAHKNRERVEDEIADDTDLVGRARRSGLVRPDGE